MLASLSRPGLGISNAKGSAEKGSEALKEAILSEEELTEKKGKL